MMNTITNLQENSRRVKMYDWLHLSGIAESVKATEELAAFAEKRGKGASKIASDAKSKGGVALLTYHHFNVKLPYYDKTSDGKVDIAKLKKEYQSACAELHSHMNNIEDMDQIKFQELLGKLEVMGELLIRNKSEK